MHLPDPKKAAALGAVGEDVGEWSASRENTREKPRFLREP